jgi:hypothetical protein
MITELLMIFVPLVALSLIASFARRYVFWLIILSAVSSLVISVVANTISSGFVYWYRWPLLGTQLIKILVGFVVYSVGSISLIMASSYFAKRWSKMKWLAPIVGIGVGIVVLVVASFGGLIAVCSLTGDCL